MNKHKEIKAQEKCPCLSNKKYSDCCKKQKIKWVRDQEGELYRRIPINEEAIDKLLNQAEKDYLDIFERSHHLTDPIFLYQYLFSEKDTKRYTIDAMHKANMPPQFIYAYKRTQGLLLSEESSHIATVKDVEDWNHAINEYFDNEELVTELDENEQEYEQLWEELGKELLNYIITLGYALNNNLSDSTKKTISSSQYFTVDDYVYICATKSIKTLRAINLLLQEEVGSDCFPLTRHMYENYLHIIYAKNKPEMLEHLIDAPLGIELQTHQYSKNKKGMIDRRKIIRNSDGAEFSGHISYYKMAESSKYSCDTELFDSLYEFLSQYTHPSFSSLTLVLNKEGSLDALSNELQDEALFYSICFAALILQELGTLSSIDELIQKDIQTVTSRIARKTCYFINNFLGPKKSNLEFQNLQTRMSILNIEASKLTNRANKC